MGGLLDLSGALHPKAYGGYLVGIGTQKIRRNFSQHQCWESRSQNGSAIKQRCGSGSVFQTRIRILAGKSSVAEPPLFWAAPEVPEPTPDPTKLGLLRLQAKKCGSGSIH